MKKLTLQISAILIFALALFACSGKQEKIVKVISVESVSLPTILTGLDVSNKSPQTPLFANILPSNATNKNIKWESSNPDVIQIIDEKTGELKIKGSAGQTTIIKVTTEDGEKTASTTIRLVEVNKNKIANKIIFSVANNKFVKTEQNGTDKYLEMNENSSTYIATIVTPLNAENKILEWSSSDSNIVSVDKKGMIKALKKGTARVSAKLKYNTDVITSLKIVVKETQKVTKVTATPNNLSLMPNSNANILLVFEPVNAQNKSVSWKSSDKNVATVDQKGKITALSTAKTGNTAIITATAKDGSEKSASVNLTIVAEPTKVNSISLDKNSVDLIKNVANYGTHQIRVTFDPVDTTNRKLIFTSQNPSVAKVSETGLVTAIAKGKTKIIVKTESKNEQNLAQTKEVSVNVENSRVLINKLQVSPKVLSSDKISQGNSLVTQKLNAIINTDATLKDVAWVSEDANIASVDEQGTVTFHKFGKTAIWGISPTGEVSDNAQILAVNLNQVEVPVNSSSSADEQKEQQKANQIARSFNRVAIKAKGQNFYFYDTYDSNGDLNDIYNSNQLDNPNSTVELSSCKSGNISNSNCSEPDSFATIARNFEIGQTEVTYRLWNAVYVWATTPRPNNANLRLADGGAIYKFQNHGELGAYGERAGTQNLFFGNDLQPVSRVSWRDAVVWSNAYTEWLNATKYSQVPASNKLKPVYYNRNTSSFTDANVLRSSADANAQNVDNCVVKLNHSGIRLPTRKEWEFTARLRSDSKRIGRVITVNGIRFRYDNGKYSTGASTDGGNDDNAHNAASAKVGYVESSTIGVNKPYTQEVGTITSEVNPCSHPLKVCDMTGNLWEWTNDKIKKPHNNSPWRANYKGGSYFKHSNETRARYDGYTITIRNSWPDIGFRIARTLP